MCIKYRWFSIRSHGSLRLGIPNDKAETSDEASVDLLKAFSCVKKTLYISLDKNVAIKVVKL